MAGERRRLPILHGKPNLVQLTCHITQSHLSSESSLATTVLPSRELSFAALQSIPLFTPVKPEQCLSTRLLSERGLICSGPLAPGTSLPGALSPQQ